MSNLVQEKNKQVMQHIQTQIEKVRTSHNHHIPKSTKILFPGKPADIPYNLDLYAYLETIQILIPSYKTEQQLKQTALNKVPIIGKLVKIIQTQLHQVARFYVNRSLGHQQEVNNHLFECLAQLTIESQKQQRMICHLQTQLNNLQEEAE